MRVGSFLAGITLCGMLCACGGSAPAPPITLSSPAPTSALSLGHSGEPMTPAGTRLRFGQDALVNFTQSGDSALVRLSATSIEKGATTDLTGWDLKSDEAGKIPYYVSITIKGDKGSVALAGKHVDGVVPLTEDDRPSTLLRLTGEGLTRCRSDAFPSNFTEGSVLNSCLIYLVHPNATVKGVAFPLSSALNRSVAPITWRD